MFKDSKVVNISRESKDREYYDPKTNDKKSNNIPQCTTQKTKD